MNEDDKIKVSYLEEPFGINYEYMFNPTRNGPIIALYNIVGQRENDHNDNSYTKYYRDDECDNDIKNNPWLYSVVLIDTAKNKIYPFTGVKHQYITHTHPETIPFLKQKQINFIKSKDTNFYYLDISKENNTGNMGELICLKQNSENIVLHKHIIFFSYEINDGALAKVQSTSYKFNISDQIFEANNNSGAIAEAKLPSIDGEEVSTQHHLYWFSEENQQLSVKNYKITSEFLKEGNHEKVYYRIDNNIILIRDDSKFYLLNREDKELKIRECKIAEELLKEDSQPLKNYKINNQSILIRDRLNRLYLLSQRDNELILKEGINPDGEYRESINRDTIMHRIPLEEKPFEEYISHFGKYLESISDADEFILEEKSDAEEQNQSTEQYQVVHDYIIEEKSVNNIPNFDSKEQKKAVWLSDPINKKTFQVTNAIIYLTLLIISGSLITTSILSYHKQISVTAATVLFAAELIMIITTLAATRFINCDTCLDDVKSNPITPNDENISPSSRNCGLLNH